MVGGETLALELALREAARHDVRLSYEDASFRYPELTLHRARFERPGPVKLKGSAEKLTVHLAGLAVQSVQADSVQLDATGSPRDAAVNDSPALRLTRSTLRWRLDGAAEPWLLAEGLSFATSEDGARAAGRVSLFGHALGNAAITWSRKEGKLSADLRLEGLPVSTELSPPPTLSLELVRATDAINVSGQLVKTPLGALLRRFDAGVEPLDGSVQGRFELAVPAAGGARGKLALSFDGLTAPHPAELRGLDIGRRIEVESGLSVAPGFTETELNGLTLRAGSYALVGRGELHAQERALRAELRLQGKLDCSAVGQAARSPGSPLSDRVATIEASQKPLPVEVELAITSRDFDAAFVRTSVGPGCGLDL